LLVSQQLNGLYFASLYRNCIQFLPAETLAPQLEYRSFIKDAVQRTQKCRVLIKVLTPESRIFVAGENYVKIAVLVVATVDQLKEQPRIQAGSDTVLRFNLRQTISGDGGAEVLCSPAGLITESDCGPVRRKVLATGVPSRAVTIPASELQAYLNSLPRLLTEHHDITLSGTNSDIVYVKDFHGYGSLSFHANNLRDCVFTRGFTLKNCSAPVIMEKLKWELGSNIPYGESCVYCSTSEVMARECSFTGYVSPNGGQVGRAATTVNRGCCDLWDCKFYNFEMVINCFGAGHIDIIETELGGEYGGSKYGVFTDLGGVAMLSDKIPATLGSGGNVTRNGGVIIQGGKFI